MTKQALSLLAAATLAAGLTLPSAQAQTPTLKSKDVGFPSLPGSLTQAGGKITIVGGGNDIWGTADNFYYAYFEVTGDFDYEVKVEDLQGPDNWTKAELMAREAADPGTGLDPGADDRHVSNMTTRAGGQNEIGLQWRSDFRGSGSAWPNDIGITTPLYRPTFPNTWLRLMRMGSKFYALAGTNGVDWVLLRGSPYDTGGLNGNETTPRTDGVFASKLLLGLAVTAHNDTDPTGGIGVFSELRAHVPVPISITTQPQATVNIAANSPLNLSVVATGDPLFYQWRKNGADIPGATGSAYSVAFAQTGDSGTYAVRLYGVGQTEVVSANAVVTVTLDTSPPTVAKASPDDTFTRLVVEFSEPVDATAETASNYALDKGITVTNVTRISSLSVALTTTKMAEATAYTLTINGVKDVAGNTIAANSTVTFKSFVFTPGFAFWERWQDVGGDTSNIDTFVDNLALPDFRLPDVTGYSVYLGSPRGVSDNYGLRSHGWFTAPQNGNYVFFLACDDQGYLFMSTNELPAGKVKIASQPGWSDQNQWNDPDTTDVRSDQYATSEWSPPNVITLIAGKQYYMEVVFREGGGGDGSEVFYKLEADPDPANGTAANLRGAVIGVYADSTLASVTITQQPQNSQILENEAATFSVQATGSSPVLLYQWQKALTAGGTFQDIPGANAFTYTTPPIPLAENGNQYRALVSVPGLTLPSEPATLTVLADTVPPTLIAARRSFTIDTSVIVFFNEVLDPTSANTATNYVINNGITVSAAALGADAKSVVLTTSPIAAGSSSTLTVTNVRDKAGNPIAAGSQTVIALQRGVLYVHGSGGANTSDLLLQSRLESQGYYVELVGATTSDDTMATGKNLVITSSTVASGEVTEKFKNSAVPVINWEQALQDDYAMTTYLGSGDRGTTAGQTSLEIVDAAHPLAAGLPAGVVQVVTAATDFAWGQPNTNAASVAKLVGTSNFGIYGYDKGALLTDGTPAPERRVQVFLTDNAAAIFTDNGWKLWDAAVNWAQNIAVKLPPKLEPPTISGTNIVITWTGGVLQQALTLTGNAADWSDVPGNPTSPYSAPTSGAPAKFFRVRAQ